MAFTSSINSISGLPASGTTAPRTVTASVGKDGAAVDSATSVLSGATGGALFTNKTKGLSEDDFLRLLMAQLQNQDPSNPMDNTDMMAQMAQLEAIQSNNNMEKAIKEMNSSFQGSVSAQQSSAQSMTNATSVSLIGKKVRIKQSVVTYSGQAGEKDSLRINLGNNKQADVQILDDTGAVLRTLKASNKDSLNSATVYWDGKTEEGTYLPAGQYTVNIAGQDKDPSLYAFAEDCVQGVSFSDKGARLKIAGKELSVADVMDVAKEEASSGIGSLTPGQAIELIGKTIRVKQETVVYSGKDGESHEFKVNAGASASVIASIVDPDGEVVAIFKGMTDKNGTAEFSWSGQSASGKFVDPGTYSIHIMGEEKNPNLYCFDEGTVSGVNTVGGAAKLRIDGKEVSVGDIIDISVKS
jgi:flagellar basal-body rod modification protein FlgD